MSAAAPVLRQPPGLDLWLAVSAAALMTIGLIAISSASIPVAAQSYQDPWHHTLRHCFYLLAGIAVATVIYRLPLRFWYNTGWLWLFLSIALLLLVLLPGVGLSVKGSQRWLPLGGFTLQPSEFAKFGLIVYLAGYLVRRESEVRAHWIGFAKPMALIGVLALLLLAEPDFGAAVILVGTALGMLFLAGVQLLPFVALVLCSIGGMAAILLAEDYRVVRLMAYTDPWADPFGSGFQVVQSLIAFGRGEWFGVGLGNSVQKLFYLPEAHNDFVISIWAEEQGFMGVLLVLALYVLLVGRSLQLGRRADLAGKRFAGHLCNGIALLFAGQAFINIGVSSGLLPTKGLTLPFISYGGSSLIVCCGLLALLLRVHHELVLPARGRQS